MSGLPGPFGGHICPKCAEPCSCTTASCSAGPEEEEIVNGCTHGCVSEAEELEREGTYKPGHSGDFPF